MNAAFEKNTGLALIVFTLLILFTMVLHPVGGNFQHLLQMAPVIVIAHSIGIISLPFAGFGFWGLSKRIGSDNFLSMCGFAMSATGLIAALMAASTNGLVLPLFISHYRDASPGLLDTLKPIMTYSHAVNVAFDFVYTGAFSLGLLFWAIAIFTTKRFPVWIAIWGIVVAIASGAVLAAGISPGSIYGFHLFVIGLGSWTSAVGVVMMRTNK